MQREINRVWREWSGCPALMDRKNDLWCEEDSP